MTAPSTPVHTLTYSKQVTMTRIPFNADWTVKPKVSGFSDLMGGDAAARSVTLPHDAMLSLPRSAADSEGPSTGYYSGGVVEYGKELFVPEEWRHRRVTVEFEAVYRDAMVFVNGSFAGQRRNGYTRFRVPLDPYLRYGQTNTIRVEARAHQDSRWYSGLGIHRDTYLHVTDLVHLAADGVRVLTSEVDDEGAVVEIVTTVRNDDLNTRTVSLHTELRDHQGVEVAADAAPLTIMPATTTVSRTRLHVREPHLWGVENPYLYRATVGLREADAELETTTVNVGIRTLRLDPRHGLRINGRTVKLRGACIHHDNGPLGAAAIGRADERRIEILKAAGFNAVRSSHNPAGSALLDACDRLGMLVVDEAFDMWFEGMKPFDYSLDFPEWWERDVEAMVAKSFNHPSVIMYSIGNEVPEAGSGMGGALARRMAEKIHALDGTRYVTNAVSSFWAVSAEIIDDFKQEVSALHARGVNDVMNAMTEIFDRITTSELVTERTAETHAAVDVAGLNYAEERYASDGKRFPNRVVLGTETNPRNSARIWPLVRDLPHVIGDFTWTGWDYLGEVGLGRTDYTEDPAVHGGGDPDYPWLLAWCGDIDITGHRRPASYYRETVFGLRSEPFLAVFRPQHHGKRRLEMQWAWTDTVAGWSWNVAPGSPVEVEVYSAADEVELLLNGKPVGRRPAGPQHEYRARFDLEYHPGELTAVAYEAGVERSRVSLRTAADVRLGVEADRRSLTADHYDLAHVTIELRDDDGNLVHDDDRVVEVQVTGCGVLQGLGSARPVTEERFDAARRTTFDGRALAVVRPTSPGPIRVLVTSDGLDPVAVELEASAPAEDGR
ncbi:glycoside hydrolase family 2 TIM barrel-domain containing protein [Streptomyces sp. AK04-3B]|uniref:glycoside hydrolase family 2 TIM barrel-domain containing protein n=1 Tax=Streptomyces sp. AK04-3B TaxID=3028650 RepID=UPI0029A1D7EE|nr:glycoside hydrolase family 2 TIM barrel-domain containing protein [Streptomyces sp. AK04-3B]MDX3798262.1 glycoside hydrolase family 2 TIM barrel-domain containing protein [Streptomyces sp. AK04-3B]